MTLITTYQLFHTQNTATMLFKHIQTYPVPSCIRQNSRWKSSSMFQQICPPSLHFNIRSFSKPIYLTASASETNATFNGPPRRFYTTFAARARCGMSNQRVKRHRRRLSLAQNRGKFTSGFKEFTSGVKKKQNKTSPY